MSSTKDDPPNRAKELAHGGPFPCAVVFPRAVALWLARRGSSPRCSANKNRDAFLRFAYGTESPFWLIELGLTPINGAAGDPSYEIRG